MGPSGDGDTFAELEGSAGVDNEVIGFLAGGETEELRIEVVGKHVIAVENGDIFALGKFDCGVAGGGGFTERSVVEDEAGVFFIAREIVFGRSVGVV